MTTLKIDIDTRPFKRRTFDKRVMLLAKTLNARTATIELVTTGKGTHARVEFYTKMIYHNSVCKIPWIFKDMFRIKIPDGLIVASQLYLGSDPARELFNIGRVFRNEKNWNVLFNAKWKRGQKVSTERNKRSYVIRIGER